MDTFIKHFISQKWLVFDPKTERSKWHMIAEFTDGTIRESYLWLRDDDHVSVNMLDWTKVKSKNAK